MLCEIESRNLGYHFTVNYKDNLYNQAFLQKQQHISSLAYMDDMQWISDNQSKLEQMLKIADDYYTFADIKVNKDKSELLLKKLNKDFIYEDDIQLHFGNHCIDIRPKHPKESTRILGVWFNMNNCRDFVINQISDEVINLSESMYRKWITDKHMLYIYNKLIIPRIEYRSQLVVLTKQEYASIISPFRKLFKRKLKLASTIPNAILDNNYIYQFRDLYELNKQSKISNFTIQINSPSSLLGKIMNIRIRQLQEDLWLKESPLSYFPYNSFNSRNQKNNFIFANLLLCKHNNFDFIVNSENRNLKIGGQTELRSIYKEKYHRYIP